MAEFPLDPPQCQMLIVSSQMGCTAEILIIGKIILLEGNHILLVIHKIYLLQIIGI